MFCANCGTQIADGVAFCPMCGEKTQGVPVQSAPVYGNAYSYQAPAQPMTKKEFWKNSDKKTRSTIITAAVCCYVSAAITLISALGTGNLFVLLDVVLVLAFGIVLHTTRQLWAAIVLLVYGVYNCIYMSISMGTFAGWLLLAAGIDALVGAISFRRAYKEHLSQF